jgi:hypothetical protein
MQGGTRTSGLGAAGGLLVQSWAIVTLQILVDEFRRHAKGFAHFLDEASIFTRDHALDVPAVVFNQHRQSRQELQWAL